MSHRMITCYQDQLMPQWCADILGAFRTKDRDHCCYHVVSSLEHARHNNATATLTIGNADFILQHVSDSEALITTESDPFYVITITRTHVIVLNKDRIVLEEAREE